MRSHRNFIELEAIGAIDLFCDAVRALGCECASFPGGSVKLIMPDAMERRDLYRVAHENHVQIRRMDSRRDSLEDIFLRAMATVSERRELVGI